MHSRRYSYQRFGESELVCYQPLGVCDFAPRENGKENNCMVHHKLNHTGRDSLFSTMSRILYDGIETYVKTCETWQRHKLQGRGSG